MEVPYIECSRCGARMLPVWFEEEEEKVENGYRYKTKRKRKALSHLECPLCYKKECVDDSFDQPWRW